MAHSEACMWAHLNVGELPAQVSDGSPQHHREAGLILTDHILPMLAFSADHSAQPAQHQGVLFQKDSLEAAHNIDTVHCLRPPTSADSFCITQGLSTHVEEQGWRCQ